MSWLLFMDESGHDHRTMPYEVRGGLALHSGQLWAFIKAIRKLELASFGADLRQYGIELKGSKLLDKRRFKWAAQDGAMADEERRRHCRGFLTKGQEDKPPSRSEFTAYGQACLEMAAGIFELLRDHGARLFAAAIPCRLERPDDTQAEDFLRKDHVFLLERFYYFLEREQQHGLLVMDQCDRAADSRFVRRLESYFLRTETGRYRSAWIVPVPLFVASDLTYPIQAADLAIYCVNWGFRLPNRGMDGEVRGEIAERFGPWLDQLQYRGRGNRSGETFETYGIVFVPDPYTSR